MIFSNTYIRGERFRRPMIALNRDCKRTIRCSAVMSSPSCVRDAFDASVISRTCKLHCISPQHKNPITFDEDRLVLNVICPARDPACHVLQKSQIIGWDLPVAVSRTLLISYDTPYNWSSSSTNNTPAPPSFVGITNNSLISQSLSVIPSIPARLRRR